MADEIRVYQSLVQVLVTNTATDVRVTQALTQVLATDTDPTVRVTHAVTQVLATDTAPTVRVMQAVVQVLAKLPPKINFTICYEDGTPPTATYDYVLLLGADVATATFMEAGTVLVTAGAGTIDPATGSSGASVILILQLGLELGAYEGTI